MSRQVINKLDGASQRINQLFDTQKMREFNNSFKRHTLYRPIRPLQGYKGEGQLTAQQRLRKGPYEYLKVYTR